ncbi:MAG: radical SAM protein [Deltaproteobacteria bacterium]|jgi:DNA repair photolyase|nr:radical SAM protein [Deltaproteobacteria bacterium]
MHYEEFKTIVSPEGGMNLYRGCTHGCIYCDSRSVCYQIKHNFEDIAVKKDAGQILAAQLRHRKKKLMIATGAMSDPYNPMEKDLGLTRECLRVILEAGFGVTVLTKSALIIRDLDILTAINEKTRCVVQMTLTTFDDSLTKKIEPGVSTTYERFEVLKIIAEAGIDSVVWLCPILPFLNDTEENLLGVLEYCLEARVRGIMMFNFGLTMREGSRDYFYLSLDRLFPGLKEKYIKMFGDRYICNSPRAERLLDRFYAVTNKAGIINRTEDVFAYLKAFPEDTGQRKLF